MSALTISRVLAGVLVVSCILTLLFPTFSRYVALIPRNTFQLHFYVWNLVTGVCVEVNPVIALINAYILVRIGDVMESIHGSDEMARLFAITGVSCSFGTFVGYYILTSIFEMDFFIVRAYGTATGLCAYLLVSSWVTFGTAEPLSPLPVKASRLPFLYLAFHATYDLIRLGMGSRVGPHFPVAVIVFSVCWLHMRFFAASGDPESRSALQKCGTVSADFALANCFPPPLSSVVSLLSSGVWKGVRAAGFFSQWDLDRLAQEAELRRAAQLAEAGPHAGSTLPGTTAREAHRRRVVALAALQTRLDAVRGACAQRRPLDLSSTLHVRDAETQDELSQAELAPAPGASPRCMHDASPLAMNTIGADRTCGVALHQGDRRRIR